MHSTLHTLSRDREEAVENRDPSPSAGKLLFLINKRPTGKTIFKKRDTTDSNAVQVVHYIHKCVDECG